MILILKKAVLSVKVGCILISHDSQNAYFLTLSLNKYYTLRVNVKVKPFKPYLLFLFVNLFSGI